METEPLLGNSNLDINADDEINRDALVSYRSVDGRDDPQKIEHRTPTQVYRLRWYILLVFSLSATLQNAAWGTWGPISQSAKVSCLYCLAFCMYEIPLKNSNKYLGDMGCSFYWAFFTLKLLFSFQPVYDWSTSLLTVIINCGNIGVFLSLIPAACLVNFRGKINGFFGLICGFYSQVLYFNFIQVSGPERSVFLKSS